MVGQYHCGLSSRETPWPHEEDCRQNGFSQPTSLQKTQCQTKELCDPRWSFDCQKSFETDIFLDGHDVQEPGSLEHVNIALRGKRFLDSLYAARLFDDLFRCIAHAELVVVL